MMEDMTQELDVLAYNNGLAESQSEPAPLPEATTEAPAEGVDLPVTETPEPPQPVEGETASPEQAPQAKTLPDELKPYENYFKSRNVDVTDPLKALAVTAKNYTELERVYGKSQNAASEAVRARDDVFNMLKNKDIDGINRVLKVLGSEELPKPQSYDEKLADLDSRDEQLASIVEAFASGDTAKAHELVGRAAREFEKARQDLTLKREVESRIGVAQKPKRDVESEARASYIAAFSSDPDLAGQDMKAFTKRMEKHLEPMLAPGGVLFASGMDPFTLLAHPQRAEQVIRIAKALDFYNNREKVANEMASAEVKRREVARVAPKGNRGGQPSTVKSNGNSNAEEQAFVAMFG